MNFLSPWLLVALGTLPLLWWLIRSLPPRPHVQSFPSLLLVRKLVFQKQNAAHTPLWLLLLRLLAMICLILGLAGLYKTPPGKESIPRKLLLVMDNGWASTPQWNQRQQAALHVGLKTLQQGGAVTFLLTAKGEDGQWAEPFTTRDPRQFESLIHQLRPSPWATDRHHLVWQLSHSPLSDLLKEADSVILSDGIAGPADTLLQRRLAISPHVQDVRWPDCSIMRLYGTLHGNEIRVMAQSMEHCPAQSLSLKGLTIEENGHFTPLTDWSIKVNKAQDITIDPAILGSLDALSLGAVPFPAGLSLLKAPSLSQDAGLLRKTGDDKPLTGDMFYLKRALESFTRTQDVTPSSLKETTLSVLIAPDDSLDAEETRKAVLDWVRKGGILIRFAGPGLIRAASDNSDVIAQSLMTVPLRPETRSLGGSMSWNTPQTLAPFPENTPLSGIPVSSDITVRRQLVAQPSEDLPHHVWASLSDGTPLITTRQEGKGRIILFHITSTANWSDLPLSGLFPQILERLINHIPHNDTPSPMMSGTMNRQLAPWKTLLPQGTLGDPAPFVRSIDPHETVTAGPEHPVGFYGVSPRIVPLNLASAEEPLTRETPLGELTKPNFSPLRTLLGPYLVLFSLLLFMTDMIWSFKRAGTLKLSGGRVGFMIFSLASIIIPAHAASVPDEALQPGLGYIISGDADLDRLSLEALDGLTRYINQRSTARLGPARGVTPGQDDLAFYPVLYWPLTASTQINDRQAAALNDYMAHNGLILMDEMGAGTVINQTSLDTMKAVLSRLGQHLTFPPLEVVTDDNILARSFYLLHDFPGRITGQSVYTARTHFNEGEDVSPLVIGNNDWAHAWAIDGDGHTLYAVLPEGEDQRALAYRFGMNIVIYALTGNYKYDQRSYPEMLKRLGQDPSSSSGSDTDKTEPTGRDQHSTGPSEEEEEP
ncbi:DUF4159 domain-containing protein [Acetobacteraceae bacterium ESL0709]|nr:DUF4159 domain-containing protein [Acetobacteraceae bacterium ESL0697]MDF7678649.1 DUF4159 domain-containing protein [Acetobacteraceae bacterium ESL0709]